MTNDANNNPPDSITSPRFLNEDDLAKMDAPYPPEDVCKHDALVCEDCAYERGAAEERTRLESRLAEAEKTIANWEAKAVSLGYEGHHVDGHGGYPSGYSPVDELIDDFKTDRDSDLCVILDRVLELSPGEGEGDMKTNIFAGLDRLVAENDQLRQDRYDALSVTSKDGLLSSEWIARTGKAERIAKDLSARVRELEEALEKTRARFGHIVDIMEAFGEGVIKDRGRAFDCVVDMMEKMNKSGEAEEIGRLLAARVLKEGK